MELLAVGLISGLFGFGLWLVGRGFTNPRMSLLADFDRLQAEGHGRGESWLMAAERRGGFSSATTGTDLAILEWTPVMWYRRRLIIAISGGLAGLVLTLLLRTQVDFPLLAGIILVPPLFTALGAVLAESNRATKAEERRKEIRAALTQFLELTSIMLAGGAGAETALEEAASNGHGQGFRLFSTELARAKEDPNLDSFVALRNLGLRLGVRELVEFGNVMILSSENAATVRQALDDKASLIVQRDHEQRRADALSRNVLMSLPVVGMAGGFIVWLVYAAIAGLANFS